MKWSEGKYYIESQEDGSMLSFNADTPFMREPVMTKGGYFCQNQECYASWERNDD